MQEHICMYRYFVNYARTYTNISMYSYLNAYMSFVCKMFILHLILYIILLVTFSFLWNFFTEIIILVLHCLFIVAQSVLGVDKAQKNYCNFQPVELFYQRLINSFIPILNVMLTSIRLVANSLIILNC